MMGLSDWLIQGPGPQGKYKQQHKANNELGLLQAPKGNINNNIKQGPQGKCKKHRKIAKLP